MTAPPIQQVVSHDHGYLKAAPVISAEPLDGKEKSSADTQGTDAVPVHPGISPVQVLDRVVMLH